MNGNQCCTASLSSACQWGSSVGVKCLCLPWRWLPVTSSVAYWGRRGKMSCQNYWSPPVCPKSMCASKWCNAHPSWDLTLITNELFVHRTRCQPFLQALTAPAVVHSSPGCPLHSSSRTHCCNFAVGAADPAMLQRRHMVFGVGIRSNSHIMTDL